MLYEAGSTLAALSLSRTPQCECNLPKRRKLRSISDVVIAIRDISAPLAALCSRQERTSFRKVCLGLKCYLESSVRTARNISILHTTMGKILGARGSEDVRAAKRQHRAFCLMMAPYHYMLRLKVVLH